MTEPLIQAGPHVEAALLSIVLLLLVAGSVLLLVGLRGRRVGDEPHCRGCGYKLLGLESKVCPECGRSFADSRVRIGVRVRRVRLIGVGLTSLLLAAGGAVFAAKLHWSGQPFIQGLPFTFIRAAARFGSTDAVNEALRRVSNSVLTPAQLRDLVDAGPRTRSELRASAASASWAKIFATLAADAALTDAQRWRLVDALVNATVENDAAHGPYGSVSIGFEYIPTVIPPDWIMRIDNEIFRLDGHPISPLITLIHGTNFGAGRRARIITAGLAAGEHSLSADFDLVLEHPIASWSRPMHLDFKVVARGAEGWATTRIPADDEVRAFLKKHIHARIAGFETSSDSNRIKKVRINLVADAPLPFDLAMKVFVQEAGFPREYIGNFLVPRRELPGLQADLFWEVDGAPPDDVTIVLRADPGLAARLPGDNGYFDGELRLGPLTVTSIPQRGFHTLKLGTPN